MSDHAEPLLLYVEDEPMVQEIGVLIFESAGYAVVTANTAPEALSALGDRGGQFHAVVTDIQLPGPGSGWEIGRRARQLFPAMPIIYVSGGSAGDWAANGVPGSVMVAKPYAAAQLVEAVSSIRRCGA